MGVGKRGAMVGSTLFEMSGSDGIFYLSLIQIYMALKSTSHISIARVDVGNMQKYLLYIFIYTPFFSGMEVVKIGGPVYRIGVGGGAASSIQVHSTPLSLSHQHTTDFAQSLLSPPPGAG